MMDFKKYSPLESNIRAHNKVAKRYERIHGEIYNDVEQARLRKSLATALSYVNTENIIKNVLDFGCGAGNLTKHLAALGCEVVASDVSQGFLDLVDSRTYATPVKTVHLNGVDLSNIPNDSVDMVATYSVLHHVPDYLAILKEFMRVLKSGGVIYIDHELSENAWQNDGGLNAFELEMKAKSIPELGKYFVLTNYVDWVIRRFINPRYRREGDIHVFEDDHIEWQKVASTLVEAGGEVLLEKDYLLFKRNYDVSVYNSYMNKIGDMHFLVARKR
jgi:ubiquinone/menaquinone biosynthesis C-methylase UbiE